MSVDLVIPVLNEAHVLEKSVRQVCEFFAAHVPYRWRVVIAENGSTDGTAQVARKVCTERPDVHLIELGQPGRGRALRRAWRTSEADIVSYTDVDLSSELEVFPRLYDAIVQDGYDLAVGSRLQPASRTKRSLRRQAISRGYNLLLRAVLNVSFSDAQTGCKAVTREVVDKVVPLVEDEGWFLDTELLVLAENLGYRIADLPITWVEDDDSRVKIVRTVIDDLRGVIRLRRFLRGWSAGSATFAAARPERLR